MIYLQRWMSLLLRCQPRDEDLLSSHNPWTCSREKEEDLYPENEVKYWFLIVSEESGWNAANILYICRTLNPCLIWGEELVLGFNKCKVNLAVYLAAPGCPAEMSMGTILYGTGWVWSRFLLKVAKLKRGGSPITKNPLILWKHTCKRIGWT